jgi:hypothetical protein
MADTEAPLLEDSHRDSCSHKAEGVRGLVISGFPSTSFRSRNKLFSNGVIVGGGIHNGSLIEV